MVLANSGEEGIEASLASNFDLILLDSDLPDLDSNEVVTRIRQIGDEQVRSVPIVGMCSENGRQQPSELVELGIEGCLEKPLQRHAIESLLQRVLHLGG